MSISDGAYIPFGVFMVTITAFILFNLLLGFMLIGNGYWYVCIIMLLVYGVIFYFKVKHEAVHAVRESEEKDE